MLLILWMIQVVITSQWCKQNPEYDAFIQRQFEPFKNGIPQTMIDTDFVKKNILRACEIIITNGIINFDQECGHKPDPDLNRLFRKSAQGIPYIRFFINILDEPRSFKNPCKPGQPWPNCACDRGFRIPQHGAFLKQNIAETSVKIPIFSATTVPECFNDILIPSLYHTDISTEATFDEQVPQWQEREFRAIWRGSNTGGDYFLGRGPHYSQHHRHKLVTLCQKIPKCDAGFTRFQNYLTREEEIATYGFANQIPMKQQAKYKIIIDIDGNTYSGRFPKVLSLAAVFKIAVFTDIGTLMTKPWVHYVPVNIDLSDFEQKLEWAHKNDRELERIFNRGRIHAISKLRFTSYVCYTRNVFLRYLSLIQKGKGLQKDQKQNQF